jgi:hypothetical protein
LAYILSGGRIAYIKTLREVTPISKLEFILHLVMMGVLVYNFFLILEVIQ